MNILKDYEAENVEMPVIESIPPNDTNLRNTGNLLNSDADRSIMTDSFCNSYYGQLLNRKLLEFNNAKNE